MRALFNYLLLFFLLFSLSVQGQTSFAIGTGIGTYKMSDLKALNRELKTSANVLAKITSSFPAFIVYDAGLQIQKKHNYFGAFWSFNSTGSRVSYKDYSGSYRYDQKLLAHQFGISYGYNIIRREGPWQVIPSARIGLINTQLEFTEFFQMENNNAVNNNYKFISRSLMISHSVIVKRAINSAVHVNCELGYLADLQKNLVLEKDHSVYLFNQAKTPQSAEWSGLRLIFGTTIKLQNNSTSGK